MTRLRLKLSVVDKNAVKVLSIRNRRAAPVELVFMCEAIKRKTLWWGANAPKLKDEANLGHVRMQSHRMNENIGGPPARAGHSLFGCPYSDITSQEKRIHEHTHSLFFSSDISTQTCITVP